jgi:hypothetical protein
MSTELYTGDNSEYLKKNPTWHVEHSPWKASQVLRILQKNGMITQSANDKIGERGLFAEVGCGAGEILNQLHQQLPDSYHFHGYDIAPDAIALAQQRKKERLDFFNKNIFETDCFFDILMAIDVFEHVPDYYGFLKACKEKATYKLFHVPLDISVINLLLNRFSHLYDLAGHIHYFTDDTTLLTLRNCDYEIIDYQYTMRTFEFLVKGTKWTTCLAALPRTLLNLISPKYTSRILGGGSLLVLAK